MVSAAKSNSAAASEDAGFCPLIRIPLLSVELSEALHGFLIMMSIYSSNKYLEIFSLNIGPIPLLKNT